MLESAKRFLLETIERLQSYPFTGWILLGVGILLLSLLIVSIARRRARSVREAVELPPESEVVDRERALEARGEPLAPVPEEVPENVPEEMETAAGAPLAPPLSMDKPGVEAPELPPDAPDEALPIEPIAIEPPESFVSRLRRGLARTQEAFVGRLDKVFQDRESFDEETLEEIEEILYTSDLGVATATRLLEDLRERAQKGERADQLREALRARVEQSLMTDGDPAAPRSQSGPHVVMFVGVNGVGKTTTIGKVGAQQAAEGKAVILAAADTFRAAAIEQLEIWGNRIGCPVIKQSAGSDPAAVAFDAVAAARSRKADVVLVDTAGRLHTKVNLMEELKKMKRVLAREMPGAPHEIILVMDATTGQNGLSQARQFHEALGLTGIALTKLDGTAKGGIVIAVHDELKLPIRYIGVGEKVDDLRPFDSREFVDALFARS
jgi:fused signal recognition particle receptor